MKTKKAPKTISYILATEINNIPHYLRYGIPLSLTPNLRDARRYVRSLSAKAARRRLDPGNAFDPFALTVMEIEE